MYEKLNVKYKFPQQRLMKCVYRLTIGDKFYIGRTKQLCNRVNAHINSIQKAMDNYYALNLYPRSKTISEKNSLSFSNYKNIAKYIFEHPKVNTLYVEVIYHSAYQKDISIVERQQLRYYENHPDCLNNVFNTGLDFSSIHQYTAKKVGRFVYYYEVDNPNELIPFTYNLRSNGHYNKPRTKSKL